MIRLVEFVVAKASWIVGAVIAVGVALIIYLAIRGQQSPKPSPPPLERRPVVRPPQAEEEGPRRVLAGAAASAAPAVEREYALVVNEEDLKMPPLPEETAHSRRKADGAPIQDLLAQKSYDDAYQKYLDRIQADRELAFAADIEQQLSEHFLRSGDLEKARRILEHHVATHPGDQVAPETYFNLGYIHFKAKTLQKSRRYFRLFVERHTDPAQVARARKILARLERVQNLN